MAQFPCEMHGARYVGPQQTIYPALVKGTVRLGHKVRVCPSCMGNALEWLQEHCTPATSELGTFGCWSCGKADADWAIFVTVYAYGEERADWFGRSCADCSPKAAMALFGPAEAILSVF